MDVIEHKEKEYKVDFEIPSLFGGTEVYVKDGKEFMVFYKDNKDITFMGYIDKKSVEYSKAVNGIS